MRYTYRRGFLWIGIYALLSLLPLGMALTGDVPEYRSFWIELGVALGFIGLAMFGLQFLYSGRFRWVAPTYGMDNILQYHKEVGIISVLFALAHPLTLILSNPDYLSYYDPGVNLLRAIALLFVTPALILIIASSLWRITFGLDYEKWRLLHGFLALSIVFIGIVHSIQVGHYMEPLWKKITLALLLGSCMYLVIHTRIIRPWLNRKKPYQIIDVKTEEGESYSLTLEAKGHQRLNFISGQFAWITVGPTPFSLQQHPFSIASSSRDKTITFTAKESGDFTKQWKNFKPGTKAFLEGPFGSFTPEGDSHLFLIMGGIGITPGMSMLRTMRDNKDRRKAILLYANVAWEEATFHKELETLSREIDLKVIHILEKPPEDWEGEKGLIDQELLEKNLPEKPEEWMYFICGPGPMMDISEISLRNLGIDWRRIYSERFEIV